MSMIETATPEHAHAKCDKSQPSTTVTEMERATLYRTARTPTWLQIVALFLAITNAWSSNLQASATPIKSCWA